VAGRAFEIPRALVVDAAVVFARGLVEGDADPGAQSAGDLGYRADVPDCAAAGVCGFGEESAAEVGFYACGWFFEG